MAGKKDLNEDDMWELYESLFSLAVKYKTFALGIKLKMSEIENIKSQYSNPSDCLLHVLAIRIKKSPPLTWSDVIKALRSQSVGEEQLANDIAVSRGLVDCVAREFPTDGNMISQCQGERIGGSGLATGRSNTDWCVNRARNSLPVQDDDSIREVISKTSVSSETETFTTVNSRKEYKTEPTGTIPSSLTSHTPLPEHFVCVGLPSRQIVSEKRQSDSEIQSNFSETDNVFHESGLSFTKREKEQLSRMFNRFFGKLCCSITDPVLLAAQMQAENLISVSVMEELLISPESCQVKSITLIRQLQSKCRNHPNDVFSIIKVLLANEGLQDTGKELWSEAGKICPHETASRLGSDDPQKHSHPADRALENGAMDSNFSSKQLLSSKYDASCTNFTPALAEYKAYLQAYYRARALAPADKYLPTLSCPFINLAMISKEDCSPLERDEFTRQTLHGGVDQILMNKIPIRIEELFSSLSKKPIRFILVEGPPGIGKSTFAWEICRRWNEILRDYWIVLLLRLREKWVLNATSLSALFRYGNDPGLSKVIARDLASIHGRNLLIIFDGFDEVSHQFHDDSIVKSILNRELLPECSILLTTRPSAKATLLSVCQPQVDKHVEIIGFTEEERVRYIITVFSKEPELQANFLKYMFLVPHIKSMMYIPLNCAIIAQVYYESQKYCYLTIPRTRTELYKALTHSLLLRHIKGRSCMHECTHILPDHLEGDDMEGFKRLAKFAFDSYHDNEFHFGACRVIKVTFFKEDIPEGLEHYGFMNESTEMYAGSGVHKTLAFLHLSLQEYLAAWHIAHTHSTKFQVVYSKLAIEADAARSDRIHTHDVCDKLDETVYQSLERQKDSLVEPAIFLAGITGWRCHYGNDWETLIARDTSHLVQSNALRHALYEAQNPSLLSHYFAVESRKSVIIIQNLTPYDSYAISYSLANSSIPLNIGVSVEENDEDISHIETFVKGLEDHGRSNNLVVTCFHVRLFSVEHSRECFFWLTKPRFLRNVEKLILEFSDVDESLLEAFLQSFVGLKHLEVYTSSPTSWQWLVTLQLLHQLKSLYITSGKECLSLPPNGFCLTENHNLTELILDIALPPNTPYDICSSTDVLIHSSLKSIQKLTHITHVALSNISRETMVYIRNIILQSSFLVSLKLDKTRLGYDGIIYICDSLRRNKTLSHLHISDDLQLPPSRVQKGSICTFISAERVPLPEKMTCTEFLLELNNILTTNDTLEVVRILAGAFLPLFYGENGLYTQWTGLGPLQQFNRCSVAAHCTTLKLKRSFSYSDLTQPKHIVFWDKLYGSSLVKQSSNLSLLEVINFQGIYPFTAPTAPIIESFVGLDPRLKECLQLPPKHHRVERLFKDAVISFKF